MIVKDLYKKALINPSETECNKLFIVSGYASATFARRHIVELERLQKKVEVNLIIGMPSSKNDHLAFVSLHNEFNGRFRGYYLQNSPPVHSKVYSWYNDSKGVLGYAGSANYSQFGFFEEQQMNQLSNEDPTLIKNYYDTLLERSIFIPDHEIVIPEGHRPAGLTTSVPPGDIEWEIEDKRVTISFLDRTGNLPAISGLNWGQRDGREKNQAYLSLKKDSRKEGFLPIQAYNFTLITDDGVSFDCVVAQEGRKAIHSTKNNSLLGEYFRSRLGVPSGSFVRIEDLEKYGRTDYTIEKIDDETFLLDFSVRK
jgi:hypothetical protein